LLERRAQPRSRLAAGHRRRRRAAALTAASTARDFAGLGTKVRAWRRHDVIPGLGLLQVAATTPHHLVSGRAQSPAALILHARVKAWPRTDGTHLQNGLGKTLGWVRSRVDPGIRRPSWLAADQWLGCSTAPVGTTPV
jgi:hypothetical protein